MGPHLVRDFGRKAGAAIEHGEQNTKNFQLGSQHFTQ
jgi:hypothetical protein